MKQNWQQAGQKVKPGLKIAGKLVLMTALRYGPAGVAGWAIKSVARKPVRMLLAVALEPMLQKVAKRLSRRYLSRSFTRASAPTFPEKGWRRLKHFPPFNVLSLRQLTILSRVALELHFSASRFVERYFSWE